MATEWDDTVELTRWLQFAEQCAERWLSRRNAQSATPLCWDDLQDILCEVRVAVLRFKLPELCGGVGAAADEVCAAGVRAGIRARAAGAATA
jgi:hypothetical protein